MYGVLKPAQISGQIKALLLMCIYTIYDRTVMPNNISCLYVSSAKMQHFHNLVQKFQTRLISGISVKQGE